jgi:hypothetical protein
MKKIKKSPKALLNLKPVIIAAIITAATSVALAIFSTGSVTQDLGELPPAAIKTLPDEETVNRLRADTPGYFNPDNYGIFGNTSLMAVMDIYENDAS